MTFRDAHLYPRSLLTWPDSIHSFGAAEGRETSRHQQISFLLVEQAANHACINASGRCSDGGKTKKIFIPYRFSRRGVSKNHNYSKNTNTAGLLLIYKQAEKDRFQENNSASVKCFNDFRLSLFGALHQYEEHCQCLKKKTKTKKQK